ncbi:MAG: hypothetical protein HKM05_07410 [Spirochaetales bacterium]|nr:hypothetical protein [Spirochaetales bacterium]
MKRLLLAVVVLTLVLGGCSSPFGASSNSGITFTIPTNSLTLPASTTSARVIAGNEARLWLYDGTTPYPNGSQVYWSTPFASGTNASVTINGIPDGANYRIVVAVGTFATSAAGSNFTPTAFATSNRFTIASGSTTSVNLSLKDISASYVFAPLPSAASVEELNGDLYAAANTSTGNTLFYTPTPLTATNLMSAGTTPGVIRSLSEGYTLSGTATVTPFLLVNTAQGVYQPPAITGISNLPLSGLVAPTTSTQPDVTWSGAASWQASGVPFSVYFYSSSSGQSFSLGGFYDSVDIPTVSNSTAQWRTVDVNNLTGINGNPLLDFALTTTGSATSPTVYAFFATRLVGTVRVNSDWLQSPKIQLSDLLGGQYFSYVPAGIPLVQALGLAPASLSGTQTLYLGTAGGAYQIADATGTTLTPPMIVNGTQGIDIRRIVTDAAGDVAFYSPTELFVQPFGKPLLRLPFVTNSVGVIHDVRWSPSTSGTLYIAGENGLAQLAVGMLE